MIARGIAAALLLLGGRALAAQPAPAPGHAPAPPAEALPIPPVPPRIAESDRYDQCLDMLPDDPSGADAAAAQWTQENGGEPARHCHALAALALGNEADGAAELDALAAASHDDPASRAELWGQASQGWTMAGDPARAVASAAQAVALSPDDPDLRITRAAALIALQRFAAAREDLDVALDLDPRRGDALTLRATAERSLGELDAAAADIARAAGLDPDNPDMLLERGIIRQRRGDAAGARADWTRAETLAEGTDTADLARQNLALLEATPPR